jgi:DNA polymerase-3 subunit beta
VCSEMCFRDLFTVGRVASGRNTLPILSIVLMKTANNRLSIAATNLDIAITHQIGSKVTQEGAITVPARLMGEFVSSLPSGVIDLEVREHKLHINAGEYTSIINGVTAEEFPVMPAIGKGQNWTIGASELKKALQQVIFAASGDEARPVLTGVYLHSADGKRFMAATDSYRLAEKSLGKQTNDVSLLLPATALQDLLRIVSDSPAGGGDEVEVMHDEQQVRFQVGDVELVTRLIEGNYPDYRKLIPQKFATTALLKRAELMNITKVSSLFARESAGSVTIEVSDEKQSVSIRAIASQLGENTASAKGTITGSGDITLNSRYLLEALHALSGEEVTLSFNGKLEPCVLKDTSDPDYLHLIMPLKS